MTVLAEFELDPGATPLGRLLDEFPGATVEFERGVPFPGEAVTYLWVFDGERDLAAGMESDEGIDCLTVVDEYDDRWLVRLEWGDERSELARALAEARVTLLSVVGDADGWRLRVRGDDREAIARFHQVHADGDARLVSLRRMCATDEAAAVTLTDPQRTALVLAYERGYYDSPRRTNLSELADCLGITRQAVAGRLRRGLRSLVEATLVGTDSPG